MQIYEYWVSEVEKTVFDLFILKIPENDIF